MSAGDERFRWGKYDQAGVFPCLRAFSVRALMKTMKLIVALVTVPVPVQPLSNVPPPRWLRPWLAVLPALYVLSPLGLLALPLLKRLPRPIWWLLGFYALSQQLPALFTPEPLLSSGLALARTAQVCALIALGGALRDLQPLRWLGVGLVAVYVTALAFSLLGGGDLHLERLTHPYLTPISVGLAGAFGVWLGVFCSGSLLWRLPLGLLGGVILLLSGSRGPLAAALFGLALGLAFEWSRRWDRSGNRRLLSVLLIGAALLSGGLYLGQRSGSVALTRLQSTDTSGRDLVWFSTLSVIQSAPVAGVGSYQLGQYLAAPGPACSLWTKADGTVPSCADWLRPVSRLWLIAHNVTLHQLAETGPLGLLGLFALLGAVAWSTLLGRDPLALAVIGGLLLATANDNTLIVPSPFFAEVFWIVAGSQLRRLEALSWPLGVSGAALLLALSGPLLANALPVAPVPTLGLEVLVAPTQVNGDQLYHLAAQVTAPPGEYRAVLMSCLNGCALLATQPFAAPPAGQAPVLNFSAALRQNPRQELRLLLYPGHAATRSLPLGQRSWWVGRAP